MSASRPEDALNPAHDTPQGLSRALTPDERPEGPHSPTTTLATLGRSARAFAAASLAPATRRAYVRALERLEGWLAGRTLEDGALADYLAQLFDAGQVVAAVRLRAKLAGTTSPAGPATARVLAGFRREGRGRGRGQVAGVRWDQADLAAALADRGSLAGLRDAAIVAVALDAMLRVSEIAALAVSIKRSNTMVVFINQLRMKIGVMFGSPETTTGGNAPKFYASVRIDIRRIGMIKKKEEVIGNETRIKVVKNKIAPPFRTTTLDLMYGTGFLQTGELIDHGVTHGVVDKSGAWYAYEGTRIGQGRENSREYLDSNEELRSKIEQKVREILIPGSVPKEGQA